MREVLFRGIDEGAKEWVYGYYYESPAQFHKGEEYYIFDDKTISKYSVIPETVGQYIGLTDKNGKKIFEGDIVKNDWCFLYGYSVVKFGQYKSADMSKQYQQGHLGFYLEHIHEVDKRTVRQDMMYFANKCEVIGNIHDNPELLKGGAE